MKEHLECYSDIWHFAMLGRHFQMLDILECWNEDESCGKSALAWLSFDAGNAGLWAQHAKHCATVLPSTISHYNYPNLHPSHPTYRSLNHTEPPILSKSSLITNLYIPHR